MKEQSESIVRDRAGDAGIRIVQAGWQVNSDDGGRIGQVVSREADSMSVRLDDGSTVVTIPTSFIAEEDESRMLATLASSARRVVSTAPRVGEPPPLA